MNNETNSPICDICETVADLRRNWTAQVEAQNKELLELEKERDGLRKRLEELEGLIKSNPYRGGAARPPASSCAKPEMEDCICQTCPPCVLQSSVKNVKIRCTKDKPSSPTDKESLVFNHTGIKEPFTGEPSSPCDECDKMNVCDVEGFLRINPQLGFCASRRPVPHTVEPCIHCHGVGSYEQPCPACSPKPDHIGEGNEMVPVEKPAGEQVMELLRVAKCPYCDGSGSITVQTSSRQLVTHEMAIDAGDRSMEGSLYSDDEWEQQQCQWCDERNQLLSGTTSSAVPPITDEGKENGK